VGGK
jgi:hypothetical protein